MLGMTFGLGHNLALICPTCGEEGSHRVGCPHPALEQALNNHRLIECPKCNQRSVDVNNKDIWECHECQTQFCSLQYTAGGQKMATDEQVILIINEDIMPLEKGVQTCWVLMDKGEGNFPFDKRVAELREHAAAFKKAISKKKRRNK